MNNALREIVETIFFIAFFVAVGAIGATIIIEWHYIDGGCPRIRDVRK